MMFYPFRYFFLACAAFALACPAQAQDFAAFIRSFPAVSSASGHSWDFQTTSKEAGKLPNIPPDMVHRFIIDAIFDNEGAFRPEIRRNSANAFSFFTADVPALRRKVGKKGLRFCFYQRLELLPRFSSVVVYFSHKNAPKTEESQFFLLNFDEKGALVNAITLLQGGKSSPLQQYSARLTADLELQIAVSPEGKPVKSDAEALRYYYSLKNGLIPESAQEKYFPYTGKFVSFGGRVCEIEQNNGIFSVIEGEETEESCAGLITESYDLEKGRFVVFTLNQERWEGAFSLDKNSITIVKSPDETVVYKRVPR